MDEIMALKLTGERVTILDEYKQETSGRETVTVRRPVMSQSGISHQIETFNIVEVETLEENLRREFEEVLLKDRVSKEIMQREMNKAGKVVDIKDSKVN